MKQFDFDAARNAVFNTVTGLSNTVFDPENVVPDRGATEGQLKSVSDIIVELRNFLDEQGCDDPWAYIKQKVDELEEAQARCCETDWGQGATEAVTQRLNELEAQIEGCCTQDHGEQDIQQIFDRIDGLEAQINDCCNRTCYDSGSGEGEYNPNVSPSSCPGSTVTVSFGWDGPNAFMHGGTATAVSSSGAPIVGYYLLALVGTGTPIKLSTSAQWSINGSGHAQWSSTASGYGVPIGVVAVDADGCEGHTFIAFPYGFVGG